MSRIYGVAAALLVGVLLFGLGWMARGDHVQAQAAEKQNARLAEAFAQGQELGVVRDKVVTKYVDRIQVIEKKGTTLIKEVPVYVSAKADAACTVNAGFVRVHDYAATEQPLPAPDPAGDADAAPSGIALSAVAEAVAENYTSCRQNAEQLTSLHELLRQYQAGTQPK